MSSNQTLVDVVKSEWIKFRTVRSSVMGVIVFFVLGIAGPIGVAHVKILFHVKLVS